MCDGFVAAIAVCIILLTKQCTPELSVVFFAHKTAVEHTGIVFKEIFAFVKAQT